MRRLAPILTVILLGCHPPDPIPPPACVPTTCEALGALCGPVGDGCGGLLACGTCASGEVCGGAGPGRCGAAVCTEAGFCWESPLPQGNGLRAAVAFGADDVWVAGGAGTVLRWNGTRWSATATGTTSDLTALWGASSTDLWAAGGDALLRWNGTAWTAQTAPTTIGVTPFLYELAGSGPDDVWLAGGAVYRWTGTSWADVPGATGVRRITVAAPDDVWAISGPSDVIRWQGTSWSVVRSESFMLDAIWAASPTDVWVGGAGGLLHFDGTSWTKLTLLAGTSIASTALTVRGSGGDDVWVVTGVGLIFHRDVSGWRKLASPSPWGFRAVAPAGLGTAWAAGDRGELVRANGTAVTPWSSEWASTGPLLTGTLAGQVVAVTHAGGGANWDGTGWQALPMGGIVDPEIGTIASLEDVWGSGLTDLWAVGQGFDPDLHRIWHRTSGDWYGASAPSVGYTPHAIWGSAARDVWAVGPSSTVSHYDGTWSSSGGIGPDLWAIWGSGPTDLWAVGDGGTILHRAVGAWTAIDSPVTADLRAVWGSGPGDVWAAGAGGALLHWDGGGWSTVTSPATHTLRRLWGSGPADVWAAGEYGELLHLDAGGWSSVFPGTRATLTAVQGDGTSHLWIGGEGVLLRLAR